MITDEVYSPLKRMKEARGWSFTELLDKLTQKEDAEKRKRKILALRGTWVEDEEEEKEVKRMLKEGWKRWNKRYVSTRM